MTSFLRIIKFALQDFGRNLGLSCMTIFILVLMLLSVNILWSVEVLTSAAVGLVKEQVNISFYLASGITDKQTAELKKYIASFPEVTEIKVLLKEQVLESFQHRHELSKEVLAALQELGGNPFGPTMIVRTKEPKDYKKIIDAISVPEYDTIIEAKSFDGHEEAIDRIQSITSRVENIGLGLSGIFALISFLIIFNTIRVAIYTQRVEISIKRLVGANSWFIRGPYLVEAVIFTLVSSGIAALCLYLGFKWLDPYITVVFPAGFSLTSYYLSHILYLILIQMGAVLLLTMASSTLAMQKHLKI